MALSAGTRLGPYEVLRAIGAGGMGEVYQGTDTRLHRTVAIKVLPPHFTHNPEMKQRFDREAQVIAGLNHPHICPHERRRTLCVGSGRSSWWSSKEDNPCVEPARPW